MSRLSNYHIRIHAWSQTPSIFEEQVTSKYTKRTKYHKSLGVYNLRINSTYNEALNKAREAFKTEFNGCYKELVVKEDGIVKMSYRNFPDGGFENLNPRPKQKNVI